MADRTLSAGTLGLRFMRNARRTQNLPHLRAEHQPVGDDAEWHVSPESTQTWDQAAYRDEKPVTYETSYLPFLFPSLHDTPTADAPSLAPRGRRAFNKRGQEITQASSPPSDTTSPQNIDREVAEHAQKSRPHSISSAPLPSLTARQPKKSTKDPSNDAKHTIFDTSGVGTDLRQSSFLRPAGVDAPTRSAKTSNPAKTALQSAAGSTPSSEPRMKRSRTSGNADKPIKKTRLELIE